LTLIVAGLSNGGDRYEFEFCSLQIICLSLTTRFIFSRVHRAGPRKQIYFEPQYVKAGIITCGGLCPGLNDVIRQVGSNWSRSCFV
jgi:hypothetical protein